MRGFHVWSGNIRCCQATCGWRIHKITGQRASGAREPDRSSASNTKPYRQPRSSRIWQGEVTMLHLGTWTAGGTPARRGADAPPQTIAGCIRCRPHSDCMNSPPTRSLGAIRWMSSFATRWTQRPGRTENCLLLQLRRPYGDSGPSSNTEKLFGLVRSCTCFVQRA